MDFQFGLTDVASKSAVAFDKEKMQALIRVAKGERTILEYSRDSGVNRELIGELINGKAQRPPSRASLKKLVCAAAKPRGDVSLYDLFTAAGYLTDDMVGKLSLGSAIASICSSPNLALALLLDTLKRCMPTRNFDAELHGGWYLVKDRESNLKYVGINAFCEDRSYAEATLFSMTSLILETLSVKEHREDLENRVYIILTNERVVYDKAKSLPKPGDRPTFILYSQKPNLKFSSGTEIVKQGVSKDWILPA